MHGHGTASGCPRSLKSAVGPTSTQLDKFDDRYRDLDAPHPPAAQSADGFACCPGQPAARGNASGRMRNAPSRGLTAIGSRSEVGDSGAGGSGWVVGANAPGNSSKLDCHLCRPRDVCSTSKDIEQLLRSQAGCRQLAASSCVICFTDGVMRATNRASRRRLSTSLFFR